MDSLRKLRATELAKVAEVIDRAGFLERVKQTKHSSDLIRKTLKRLDKGDINIDHLKTVMKGNLATYLLHW
jgi:ribosomal protein S8